MQKNSQYFLGIDQGTTQTTAVVINLHGEIVSSHSVQLAVQFPQPGWIEQDPWEILKTVKQASAPLLEIYPITAAGFDNQGETFILWDRTSGEPLTPAIVWQDKRGEVVCKDLAEIVDNDWLHQRTGLRLDSYFSAPKIRFVLDNDPELRTMADRGQLRFGTTETWVLWNLSDRQSFVTDPSTASRTLLFNIHQNDWDDDLLELFNIPRSILPEILPSSGYVNHIDFGLGKKIPLYAMLVDQQAALFGQACFTPGDMKCTFGTGSFLLANTGDKPLFSSQGLLTTVAWDLGDQRAYALDGGIFITGAAVQWLADNLQLLPAVTSSSKFAFSSKDSDVVCVPALAGLAAPHWQTDIRGAMFGLSRATTPADLVRATLEGIAFRVNEVVQVMISEVGAKPDYLKVDGGPTMNVYLMQFLADILEMEVRVAAARESTAIGMANLAAHSASNIGLDVLAERWQAEANYYPGMDDSIRQQKIDGWQRALMSVQIYHGHQPSETHE